MPESLDSTLEYAFQKVIARLQEKYAGLVEHFPFERYAAALSNSAAHGGYSSVDKRITALCTEVTKEYSSNALDLYHRSLLLFLLIQHQHKMLSAHYPIIIQNYFQRDCHRIAKEVEYNPVGFYDFGNDLFCKDLGVSTLRMFPARSLKVEALTGIPRRIIFSNKGRDLFQWLKQIKRDGGFNPFYEIHLDIRYREDFTPEGWDAALRAVGDMLIFQPHIKGITGASWFFDPQIRTVSPRLAYLRQHIEDRGGRFFYYKTDKHTTELAISSSLSRRQLFQDGQYKPASYFMVWPRKEILQGIHQNVILPPSQCK